MGRTFQARMLEGETRRDELARALSVRPAFVLLDEPAAGATDRERSDLVDTLRGLRDGGLGLLVVDHDIELLSRLSDRLVCLDRGRLLAVGAPADVRADPRVRASFLGLDDGGMSAVP